MESTMITDFITPTASPVVDTSEPAHRHRCDVLVNQSPAGLTVAVREPQAFPRCRRRGDQPAAPTQPMIQQVACEIVSRQRGYFERGVAGLTPLNMQTVADAIGVNVGTVSRTIAGRFMQTPTGSVPVKFFFTRGYRRADGNRIANTHVQSLIGQMIAEEDPRHALSDPVIDARLRQRGVPVARRTVSKYRAALGLPAFRTRRAG